jgi:uncharacterized cupredoxin-like copper-binding protein
MRDPRQSRGTLLALGLLGVAACGDDTSADRSADGGAHVDDGHVHDAAVGPSATDAALGDGHAHDAAANVVGSDAALGDGHAHGADASVTNTGDATVDPTCTATIKLLDFTLSPAALIVKGGDVVLCTQNDGQAPHDLGIRDAAKRDLMKTPVLATGQRARLVLTLTPGTYGIYCTQAGHESLGMTGSLTAE